MVSNLFQWGRGLMVGGLPLLVDYTLPIETPVVEYVIHLLDKYKANR